MGKSREAPILSISALCSSNPTPAVIQALSEHWRAPPQALLHNLHSRYHRRSDSDVDTVTDFTVFSKLPLPSPRTDLRVGFAQLPIPINQMSVATGKARYLILSKTMDRISGGLPPIYDLQSNLRCAQRRMCLLVNHVNQCLNRTCEDLEWSDTFVPIGNEVYFLYSAQLDHGRD